MPPMELIDESSNLTQSLREMSSWQSAGHIIEDTNSLVSIATTDFPMGYANCALRKNPNHNADESLSFFESEFQKLDRKYVLWIKSHEDSDLESTAINNGYQEIAAAPWMRLGSENFVRSTRSEELTFKVCSSRNTIEDLVSINKDAYQSLDVPASETDEAYWQREKLLHEKLKVVVGYHDDVPVTGGLLLLSEGLAGIYWVGTKSEYRKKGYGKEVTEELVAVGKDFGYSKFFLLATPFGESIYKKIGFETVSSTKWLLSN